MKLKRVLSVILAVCLCLLNIFLFDNCIKTAAYTSCTADEAVEYLYTLVGQKVGSGECVALIVDYYQYLGVPRAYGNAEDYATNLNAVPSGWTREKGAQPQKGDIMIWTGTKYGHVAICGGSEVYFHQNWDGRYVSIKNKSYTGGYTLLETGERANYWGVIRPDFENAKPTISNLWIKTSKSGLFLGESISFTFGADNATSYGITIKHLDTVVKTEENVKSGVSYTFIEEGSYTAYITAKNGSVTKDSSIVNFYIVDALDMGSYFVAKLNNPVSGYYVSAESSGINDQNPNVYLASESSNDNNEWKFIRQDDYSYKIINIKTGYYLSVSGGNTENGTNIDCAPDDGTVAQRWYIRNNISGYALVPKKALSSDLSITGNGWIYNDCIFDGANISLYDNDSVQSQRFVFEYIVSPVNEWISVDKKVLTSVEKLKFDFGANCAQDYLLHVDFADGSILEKTINPGDSLSFDLSGLHTAYIVCILNDGTEIKTETVSFYNMKIHDFGQSFKAKIQNIKSGFFLSSELTNNSYYNVFIASQNLSENNVWKFERQQDGSYIISNTQTGYVLDLADEKFEDGTNIICNYKNGKDTQSWFITSNLDGYALAPKNDYTKLLSVFDNNTIWWYGEATDGANIVLYDLDNVQSQRFKLLISGDLTGDNAINILDLVRIKKILAGNAESVSSSPDFDNNGEVDVEDIIILRKFILGLINEI